MQQLFLGSSAGDWELADDGGKQSERTESKRWFSSGVKAKQKACGREVRSDTALRERRRFKCGRKELPSERWENAAWNDLFWCVSNKHVHAVREHVNVAVTCVISWFKLREVPWDRSVLWLCTEFSEFPLCCCSNSIVFEKGCVHQLCTQCYSCIFQTFQRNVLRVNKAAALLNWTWTSRLISCLLSRIPQDDQDNRKYILLIKNREILQSSSLGTR